MPSAEEPPVGDRQPDEAQAPPPERWSASKAGAGPGLQESLIGIQVDITCSSCPEKGKNFSIFSPEQPHIGVQTAVRSLSPELHKGAPKVLEVALKTAPSHQFKQAGATYTNEIQLTIAVFHSNPSSVDNNFYRETTPNNEPWSGSVC